jgi:micrococcal nuclease
LKTRLVLLLTLALPGLAAAALIPAEVLKVEDGDTLVVNLKGEETRIQLQGIDAPEDAANPKLKVDMKRTSLAADALLPLGEAATAHLKFLVKPGERVVFSGTADARDRYGRLPGEILTRDGLSLNAAMVADGYARVLQGSQTPAELQQRLQMAWEVARQKRKGLWSSNPRSFKAWAGLK